MSATQRRDAHQKFVRQGEQELAKEMSFRDVRERARNAHTLGTVTLTNKIERMHKRVREQQVKALSAVDACPSMEDVHRERGSCYYWYSEG